MHDILGARAHALAFTICYTHQILPIPHFYCSRLLLLFLLLLLLKILLYLIRFSHLSLSHSIGNFEMNQYKNKYRIKVATTAAATAKKGRENKARAIRAKSCILFMVCFSLSSHLYNLSSFQQMICLLFNPRKSKIAREREKKNRIQKTAAGKHIVKLELSIVFLVYYVDE